MTLYVHKSTCDYISVDTFNRNITRCRAAANLPRSFNFTKVEVLHTSDSSTINSDFM